MKWIKSICIKFFSKCIESAENVGSQTLTINIEKKHRLIIVEIHFYDNTEISFSQKNDIESTKSYVVCFYPFYNWFFNRLDSQWFSFNHSEGANIIKRENIKQIKFKTKIITE